MCLPEGKGKILNRRVNLDIDYVCINGWLFGIEYRIQNFEASTYI